MSGTESTDRPECIGDPGDRHTAVEIEKHTTADGETHWTCPICDWLLKEFMGVHVDDV